MGKAAGGPRGQLPRGARRNPDLTVRVSIVQAKRLERKASGDGADAGPHQTNAVEISLFASAFFGAFARLIALVQ